MLALPELDFRRTPVVLTLTAIAAALEIACVVQGMMGGAGQESLRDVLYNQDKLGLLSPVWSGELWRPLTTSLLHGDFFHAAFNIYWMLIFGGALERRFGSWRVLLLIVLLGYTSMMPQFVFSNWNVSDLQGQQGAVGLSGILYGLFGMLLIGRRHEEKLYEACTDQNALLMGIWFVFCIVADKFEIMPVANVAHAAGVGFGLLYGCVVFDRPRRWLWFTLALPLTLVALATLVYVPGCKLYERHRAVEQRIDEHRQLRRLLKEAFQPPENAP